MRRVGDLLLTSCCLHPPWPSVLSLTGSLALQLAGRFLFLRRLMSMPMAGLHEPQTIDYDNDRFTADEEDIIDWPQDGGMLCQSHINHLGVRMGMGTAVMWLVCTPRRSLYIRRAYYQRWHRSITFIE